MEKDTPENGKTLRKIDEAIKKATLEVQGLQLVANTKSDILLRLRCLELASSKEILSKMHEAKTMYNWIVDSEKPAQPQPNANEK